VAERADALAGPSCERRRRGWRAHEERGRKSSTDKRDYLRIILPKLGARRARKGGGSPSGSFAQSLGTVARGRKEEITNTV